MNWTRVVRGGTLLVLVAALCWSMIWQLDPEESGVVLRFGRVARTATSGVTLTLPWPIERLERVAANRVQTIRVGVSTDPAQDDLISPAKSLWLTGDTNILLLRLELQVDVKDPVAYLTRFGGEESNAVVRQAAESSIINRIGGWPIDDVRGARRSELVRRTKTDVQATLDTLNTGLHVLSVNVEKLEPPTGGGVATAFRAVETATQQASASLERARGQAVTKAADARSSALNIETAARRDAQKRVARAQILADRVRALSPQSSELHVRQRLMRDMARDVLGRVKKVRVPMTQRTLYLTLPAKRKKQR